MSDTMMTRFVNSLFCDNENHLNFNELACIVMNWMNQVRKLNELCRLQFAGNDNEMVDISIETMLDDILFDLMNADEMVSGSQERLYAEALSQKVILFIRTFAEQNGSTAESLSDAFAFMAMSDGLPELQSYLHKLFEDVNEFEKIHSVIFR